MLITTDRRWEPLSQKLPKTSKFDVACRAEYFLRNRQLLLLTSRETGQQLADQRADDLGMPY
jgi:hypothetical protein